MTLDTPSEVFCAVRGGPESRRTVTHAIDLAVQLGARLTFFQVMDAEFLNHATVGPLSVVYQELGEIAQFAMLILCDRAQRRGVREADYIIRDGAIHKQLQWLVSEAQAGILVMGRPSRGPGRNHRNPFCGKEGGHTLCASLTRSGLLFGFGLFPGGRFGSHFVPDAVER
jgi:nucleotide-binding universal stress UspA family protein